LNKADFIEAFTTLRLDEKQQTNIFARMLKAGPAWVQMVKNSFLSKEFKTKYVELIKEQLAKIS
jgi:serine/threonine-protein kinase HipA